MHILLTDILSCPRCGPEFGLILMAKGIEDRRVLDGILGCANCREQYGIRGGRAELGVVDWTIAGEADDAAIRLGAFLGVTAGPGFVLLVGPGAGTAAALAGLVPNLEVITPAEVGGETVGVSRVGIGATLPFYNRHLQGVALSGRAADVLLEEGVRVLRPGARLVLVEAPANAGERLTAGGMQVVAQQGGTVIATRG